MSSSHFVSYEILVLEGVNTVTTIIYEFLEKCNLNLLLRSRSFMKIRGVNNFGV